MCLEAALRRGAAWWVAPSYKVAAVGWRQLKGLAAQLSNVEIKEADKKILTPGGGWVQVRSADEPNSLRGEGLDRVVIDECAFIAEAAWTEAIRPALSDRKGDALFISTPKGRNWFWRVWQRGRAGEGDWAAWRFPSVSNPFLDPAEVLAAKADLPDRVYEQEYNAEFLDDQGAVFRNVSQSVDKGRRDNEAPEPGSTYYLGVDLARTEDFTVLSVVRDDGRHVYFERFNQISWERQLARIGDVARRFDALVVVDSTGIGDPLAERLRRDGLRLYAYTLTNASKEALIDNLAIRIEKGEVRLLDLEVQTNELLAYQYELTPSRNVKMGAPEGMHDDTVIALALACWGIGKRRTLSILT
jgi:phage FluMu gp28-like protein